MKKLKDFFYCQQTTVSLHKLKKSSQRQNHAKEKMKEKDLNLAAEPSLDNTQMKRKFFFC